MEDSYASIQKNSKKQIEDSFKAFMSKYFSIGPDLAKVFTFNNGIIIYCKNFLTSLEKSLLKLEQGEIFIEFSREKIIRYNESDFLSIVNDNVDSAVKNYYVDFNAKDNSFVCVFILNN